MHHRTIQRRINMLIQNTMEPMLPSKHATQLIFCSMQRDALGSYSRSPMHAQFPVLFSTPFW